MPIIIQYYYIIYCPRAPQKAQTLPPLQQLIVSTVISISIAIISIPIIIIIIIMFMLMQSREHSVRPLWPLTVHAISRHVTTVSCWFQENKFLAICRCAVFTLRINVLKTVRGQQKQRIWRRLNREVPKCNNPAICRYSPHICTSMVERLQNTVRHTFIAIAVWVDFRPVNSSPYLFSVF